MESGTAKAPAPDRRINNSDCADRILKAVQERAISAAEERTRTEVTRALMSRFDLEISKLQAAFDRRLNQVVAETEGLAQLKLESTLASAKETLREQVLQEVKSAYQAKLDDAQRLIDQLKENAEAAASEWVAERQRLHERIATTERALDNALAACTERVDEHTELQRHLAQAKQSNAQLQMDLQRAVSEMNLRSLAGNQNEADFASRCDIASFIHSEIIRVRIDLDQIEKTLADPTTELGTEIRLKRDQAQLHAYLKGLRYSLEPVAV